jgi:hypothetical protein
MAKATWTVPPYLGLTSANRGDIAVAHSATSTVTAVLRGPRVMMRNGATGSSAVTAADLLHGASQERPYRGDGQPSRGRPPGDQTLSRTVWPPLVLCWLLVPAAAWSPRDQRRCGQRDEQAGVLDELRHVLIPWERTGTHSLALVQLAAALIISHKQVHALLLSS